MQKLAIGDWIDGKYLVLSELGAGGMSTVFLCEDPGLKRKLAVKVLHLGSLDSSARQRMTREAKALSGLVHRNIVRSYHFALFDDKNPYLAMEYVEGQTLRQLLQKEHHLRCDQALTIALQLCAGIKFAHDLQIIHRDLKPENIMLCKNGDDIIVRILDFGLCKLLDAEPGTTLTQTGMIMGTPMYMDPEVIMGMHCRLTTDIYSFACIFYEMLAGEPPFFAETPGMIYQMHVCNPFPSLQTFAKDGQTIELEAVIRKCAEKAAADRYQRFDEVIAALQNLDATKLAACSAATESARKKKAISSQLMVPLVSALALIAILCFCFSDDGISFLAMQVQNCAPAMDASKLLSKSAGWLLQHGRENAALRIVQRSTNSQMYFFWSPAQRAELLWQYIEVFERADHKREAIQFCMRLLADLLDQVRQKNGGILRTANFAEAETLNAVCKSLLKMHLDESDWAEIANIFEKHDVSVRKPLALIAVSILRTEALLRQKNTLGIGSLGTLTDLCAHTAYALATDPNVSSLRLAEHFDLEAINIVHSHHSVPNFLTGEREIQLRDDLGYVYLRKGEFDLAKKQYDTAAKLAKEIPILPGEALKLQSVKVGSESKNIEKALEYVARNKDKIEQFNWQFDIGRP